MKIALIGYGVENASAYRYLISKYADAEYTVYDQSEQPRDPLPEGVAYIGGLTDFKDIEADLLVRSPGIAPYKLAGETKSTSATKLFFEACTVPIIGVTGSKGKGTTASLIASVLSAGGKTPWLVGNIGLPALDVLPKIGEGDIVVYELSSFQLWDMQQSPETAVVLMIEPEHLDVHTSVEDYVGAKANIAKWQHQNDRIIYNAGNEYSQQIARLSSATHIPYPDESTAHIKNETFYYGETELCAVSELQLPGMHNRDNAIAAINAAWPWVSDPTAIANGLHAFDGLPHRLKFVAERSGVKFYDDSIATTPGSAIAALHAFDETKVLILGGSSKGVDFDELARTITQRTVRKVLLIGDEAATIAASLDRAGFSEYEDLGINVSMAAIVQSAAKTAQSGDIVILSPACASFGMFKNYSDRGDQFIHAVNQL